jgi:flagellar hook protein FlgE
MGMISNNIANVSTVGYKRRDAAFSSLVTSESRSTLYSPGSVRAAQVARIDQQGILQQSNSTTDIAMSGNGFFVVKRSATDPFAEPLYTRAGSFSENANGILTNTSGFTLFGWPLDQDGNVVGSQTDVNSLVPVDVAFLGGLTQPTTTASLNISIDKDEAAYNYPVQVTDVPNFSRDIRVYDSLGGAQSLRINFKKSETPTANTSGVGTVDLSAFQGPIVGNVPGIAAGDTFTFTIPSADSVSHPQASIAGNTVTVTIGAGTTVAEMLAAINSTLDADGDPVVYANIDSAGHLNIKNRNIGESLVLAEGVGGPLSAMDVTAGTYAAPAAPDMLMNTADTANTEGWWQVEILSGSPPYGSIRSGYLNFNGLGKLNALPNADGNYQVNLAGIDWGNGAELQDINFDVSGFSQFSGEYNVISTEQNGAELGLRTGVSIDRDGFVTAQFSNGRSAKIYKLPVATFANVNGLDELTGNVYRQSDASGDYNLREAGRGSAGQIEGGALEASNVDLADEFSKMIVTQRAYSANTKVITTADEMTAELLRLR